MFTRILVPTDGTPRSDRALKVAARLARSTGAVITIFHAVPTRTPFGETAPFDPKRLQAQAERVSRAHQIAIDVVHTKSDTPAQAIVAAARKTGASVIVMASHGHRGIDKLLLGSETQRVLARAEIPVLVIK